MHRKVRRSLGFHQHGNGPAMDGSRQMDPKGPKSQNKGRSAADLSTLLSSLEQDASFAIAHAEDRSKQIETLKRYERIQREANSQFKLSQKMATEHERQLLRLKELRERSNKIAKARKDRMIYDNSSQTQKMNPSVRDDIGTSTKNDEQSQQENYTSSSSVRLSSHDQIKNASEEMKQDDLSSIRTRTETSTEHINWRAVQHSTSGNVTSNRKAKLMQSERTGLKSRHPSSPKQKVKGTAAHDEAFSGAMEEKKHKEASNRDPKKTIKEKESTNSSFKNSVKSRIDNYEKLTKSLLAQENDNNIKTISASSSKIKSVKDEKLSMALPTEETLNTRASIDTDLAFDKEREGKDNRRKQDLYNRDEKINVRLQKKLAQVYIQKTALQLENETLRRELAFSLQSSSTMIKNGGTQTGKSGKQKRHRGGHHHNDNPTSTEAQFKAHPYRESMKVSTETETMKLVKELSKERRRGHSAENKLKEGNIRYDQFQEMIIELRDIIIKQRNEKLNNADANIDL